MYTTKALNEFSFAIGSSKSVPLSFNKHGRLLNHNLPVNVNQNQCDGDKSNLLYVHTKITDFIPSKFVTVPYVSVPAKNTVSINTGYIQPNVINNNLLVRSNSRVAFFRANPVEFAIKKYYTSSRLTTLPTTTTITTTTTSTTTTTTTTTKPRTTTLIRYFNRLRYQSASYGARLAVREQPIVSYKTQTSSQSFGSNNLFEMNNYRRARKFKKSANLNLTRKARRRKKSQRDVEV